VLFLYFEDSRDGMAIPTADVRVEPRPFGFLTECGHFYPPLKGSRDRASDLAAQAHELAGVGPVDIRYRAGPAKITAPGRPEQAAFFLDTTSVVVAVKILTFSPCGCLHVYPN
jgi:hypothetical protein